MSTNLSDYEMKSALADPDTYATSWREAGKAKIAAINARTDLTRQGRIQHVEKVRADTNDKLAALSAAVAAAESGRIESLRKRIFSPPTPMGATASDRIAIDASHRDAMDRVGRTDHYDDTLRTILERAALTGDKIQSKAALAVALERNDVDAVNAYLAAYESEAADIDEYHSSGQGVSAQRRVFDSFRFVGI